MRIASLVGLLMGLGMASVALAGQISTLVVDDFTSTTTAWKAWQPATITHETDALKLRMPKYSGPKGGDDWSGMVRQTTDWPFADYNGIQIDLTNPTDHTQTFQIKFKNPQNHGTQAQRTVAPGARRTFKIYFDHLTPGVSDWSDIQRIYFTRTRPSESDVWLIHQVALFRDDAAATVMGQLRSLLNDATDAFNQAKSAGVLSQDVLAKDAAIIARWTAALKSPAGIRGKSYECYNDLAPLQSAARTAALGRQLNKPVVLWSVPLGTRFEPAEAMTQYHKPAEKLELYAARGEYQDGIVRVTNLSDATQDWKVSINSKDSAAAAALSVRRNQCVLAGDHSVVGDVLTPLDGAGVVSVAPGETAELWITADVKHHDWTSGKHEAELALQDLRRGDASIVKLPIDVTIRNFNLADAPPMHLNMWSYQFYPNNALPTAGREEAALTNLVDYGCDIFVINDQQLPWPKLSPDGEPAAPLDFTSFDKLVKYYRSRGPSTILLFLALADRDNAASQARLSLKSGLKYNTPAWNKGVRYWLDQLMQRMQKLGVPMSQYALYINDEPDVGMLDTTRAVAKIAKSIDPAVRIYMDSSNLCADPKLNDDLMNLVSIEQPNGDNMNDRPTLLPNLKKYSNLKLWVYQCRVQTRRRYEVNAYEYYRLLAWRAQRDGMNGIGYWIYSYYAAKDLWDGTTGGGASVAYPDTDKGMLASPRWELIRTSLDDVKYYRLLEKAGKSPATEALLGKRFDEVIAHPHDPALAVQWRIDAGAAIEAAQR